MPDLTCAVLDLAIDGETGLWHLTNETTLSWYDFARQIAMSLGLDPDDVTPALSKEMGWIAPRPRSVGLRSERGSLLPPLEHSLQRYASVTLDKFEL